MSGRSSESTPFIYEEVREASYAVRFYTGADIRLGSRSSSFIELPKFIVGVIVSTDTARALRLTSTISIYKKMSSFIVSQTLVLLARATSVVPETLQMITGFPLPLSFRIFFSD